MPQAVRTSSQSGQRSADSMTRSWSSLRSLVCFHSCAAVSQDLESTANNPTEASSDSTKAKFDSAISTIRWTSTNGLMLFLQFWYMKQPMFWIPQGFVPYYAEWLISSPAAPLGSVSIMVWSMACAKVISLVSEAIVAMIALATKSGATSQKLREEPMKVPSKAEGKEDQKEQ